MSRKSASQRAAEVAPLPQRSWDQLFGYDQVYSDMRALIQGGGWPQAFLLEGREGIGKRALLAKIAATFYCEAGHACGSCAACRAVRGGYQPDLLWIEPEGAIKVAEADLIQEHLQYQSSSASFSSASSAFSGPSIRSVVIVDIEELTDQAANRLLKTLEEPPPQTRLLLSCSRPRQLLPTILSRLVRWHLRPPAPEASLDWLMAKSKAAGFSLEAPALREALAGHAYSPGRTWNFIEREQKGLGAALDRLESILLGPFDGLQLAELQELIKQNGWKADEFAQLFERILNRSFKAELGLRGSTARPRSSSMLQRQEWRRVLQQVYRAGGSGHNYLNTQMVAEALLSGGSGVRGS